MKITKIISKKIVDFKSSLEDLIVRLDFINTKKCT